MTDSEKEAKIALLHSDLSDFAASFEKKASYNRKASKNQHGAIAILGAVIPVLTGLNLDGLESHIRIIISVLGAIISIVSAYKAFFNNSNLWIRYTRSSNEFKKINGELNFYLAGKPIADVEPDFLEELRVRMQKVLDDTNDGWGNIRGNTTQ